MPKTYTDLTNVSTGDVLSATAYNNLIANSENVIVPPMAQIALTSSVSVANASHTSFAGFTNTNASEQFDTDGMVTLSATASAITVQTDGIYLATATAAFDPNATGLRYARIVRSRSGTLLAYGVSVVPNVGGVVHQQNTVTALIDCQAGDLIRLMVYQDSGGALNLIAGATTTDFGRTMLSAIWVGKTAF